MKERRESISTRSASEEEAELRTYRSTSSLALRVVILALGIGSFLPASFAQRPKPPAAAQPKPPRTLADLVTPAPMPGEFPPPPRIDDAKAKAAGLRKLTGKHVTIYTDVPAANDVDDLPQVFDAAVPLWCEYFKVDPKLTANWHLVSYLAANKKDVSKFTAAGLWPASLPPFLNGFQQGAEFWEYDQPSAYYRRHLMIHEGTHAFMTHFLGGNGPPWFNEGLAELMGTHVWKDGKLRLNVIPAHRDDAPYWGRVKILKDQFAVGRALPPLNVMQLRSDEFLQNDSYGWAWGAAFFFDHHPRTAEAFRKLQTNVGDRSIDFSTGFKDQLGDEWAAVQEDWQLFVAEADYGYDVARAAVVRKPAAALPAGGTKVKIAADRGWQSTGIRFDANVSYQLKATGRYQIGKTKEVWWCEPGGVTIHYHNNQPLGMLVASLGDWDEPREVTPLLGAAPVGLETKLKSPRAGTLYLKINEPAARLADNAGELEVVVTQE